MRSATPGDAIDQVIEVAENMLNVRAHTAHGKRK
jgi:hypothetical protein